MKRDYSKVIVCALAWFGTALWILTWIVMP